MTHRINLQNVKMTNRIIITETPLFSFLKLNIAAFFRNIKNKMFWNVEKKNYLLYFTNNFPTEGE